MNKVPDISISSLDLITAWNMDGTFGFMLDELQNASLAHSEERETVTGKGGRTLNTLKKNKAVTISGTNGLVSGGLLETQTGGSFEKKQDAPVVWTDYLTVNSNVAETSYIATGTAGDEITALYVKNSDGTLGDLYVQAATVGQGKFTYAPQTKQLAFAENELDDGTEIVVFYTRKVAANVLTNQSDVYSKKMVLYVDATGEDKCSGKLYHIQFYIPKADFNGEFTLDLGDNQTVHNFEATSLATGCGAGAKGALWTYTIFGVDTGDTIPQSDEGTGG